jgi:hypothetical protein
VITRQCAVPAVSSAGTSRTARASAIRPAGHSHSGRNLGRRSGRDSGRTRDDSGTASRTGS